MDCQFYEKENIIFSFEIVLIYAASDQEQNESKKSLPDFKVAKIALSNLKAGFG